MWKAFWRKWTVDKPAILGDWMWDVFVVQFAAFLDRLRRIVAFIPVVILILAYYHRIPIPPELLLLGDLLAYIDIFSMLFLVGMLSRAATLLFIIKQVAARVGALVRHLMPERQLDFRHRRERDSQRWRRSAGRSKKDDEELFCRKWDCVGLAT